MHYVVAGVEGHVLKEARTASFGDMIVLSALASDSITVPGTTDACGCICDIPYEVQ